MLLTIIPPLSFPPAAAQWLLYRFEKADTFTVSFCRFYRCREPFTASKTVLNNAGHLPASTSTAGTVFKLSFKVLRLIATTFLAKMHISSLSVLTPKWHLTAFKTRMNYSLPERAFLSPPVSLACSLTPA